MTDKQIIKEKGNQKCIFYNDDICRKGDKTRDCLNCARVEYHSLYKLNWENQERLESQLEAKEQECEELKKQRTAYIKEAEENFEVHTTLKDNYRKLYQTLTEIKEIAEFYNNSNMDNICYQDGIYEILQKISECEVE